MSAAPSQRGGDAHLIAPPVHAARLCLGSSRLLREAAHVRTRLKLFLGIDHAPCCDADRLVENPTDAFNGNPLSCFIGEFQSKVGIDNPRTNGPDLGVRYDDLVVAEYEGPP